MHRNGTGEGGGLLDGDATGDGDGDGEGCRDSVGAADGDGATDGVMDRDSDPDGDTIDPCTSHSTVTKWVWLGQQHSETVKEARRQRSRVSE